MTRTPFLGVPVACAAGLFFVCVATAAQRTTADLTLGTGVPDAGILGIFALLLLLPVAATALVAMGLTLAGTWEVRTGRTGLLTTAAGLTLVVGGPTAATVSSDRVPFAPVLVGLCLVSLLGLGSVRRSARSPR